MPRTEAGKRLLDAATYTEGPGKDSLAEHIDAIEDEAREQEVKQWNPLVGKAIMVTRAAERERYEILREAAESVATVYRDKKDRMKWPAMLRLIEVLDEEGDIR